FARLRALAQHVGTADMTAIVLAAASLATILLMPKLTRRLPGSIAAVVLSTAAVAILRLPVEHIGSKFRGNPWGLPALHIPVCLPDLIIPLLPSAMTVAILAAIESLLSAVVADSMSGDRHNSNVELVAQGAANLLTPMVGGIPVTGAIARTATNYRSGAKSPVAGMTHALTLLAVVLALAPLARSIPLARLAAGLCVAASNRGEWREIGGILRLSAADKSVWLITFVLTVVADLTVAVEVGMALAALLYIYRISQTTTVTPVTTRYIEEGRPHI